MKRVLVENEVFMKTFLDFLKHGAVEGEDLETTIVDVFSELYSDEPGPLLQRFAYYLITNMQLKHMFGSAMLDQLHAAAQRREDIYDLCDKVQRRIRRKICLPATGIINPRLHTA